MTAHRRDHAELPDDFEERAAAIEDNHMANPVKEELRGKSGIARSRCAADRKTRITMYLRNTGTNSTRNIRRGESISEGWHALMVDSSRTDHGSGWNFPN
jgi:hypothetical protein